MGIYDREYYRRDGPSFLQSLTERGKVCKWIILANVGVFVIQVVSGTSGDRWFTEALELRTWDVLHGELWRLLTYAFLHDPTSVFHILFNMLFLWWFGTEIE